MELTYELFFIALALAMDAFAVAVSNGIMIAQIKFSHALKFGLFFGFFQFIMPIMGYLGSMKIMQHIYAFDHWVAFTLLIIIGGKMLKDSFEPSTLTSEVKNKEILSIRNMTFMAVATSIDAMAVGVGFAVLGTGILFAAFIIGIVAFIMSFSGVLLGKKIGVYFQSYAEKLGGCILIFIGGKILLEHLTMGI